jgi:capsular exopolysaccharide synthesis family protein
MSGEGKTSLATHLAASLARSRRNTLLIDCDLRNPSLHRLFDLPRQPGFSEVLRDEAPLAQAVQATHVANLSVMSAGRCDTEALQELAQDRLGTIFQQLKDQFEFIIVDSAPALPVVDSLLVGQHMDGLLLSVMHEVSSLPKVYAAYQRMELLGLRILGAVMSGTPRSAVYGSGYRHLTKVEE